jgi:RNA polymerase sigma factor (sigma-70 family)
MTTDSKTREREEQLILDNMGLVVSLARSFKPKDALELDDYIQSGRIGLWKAIQKHNPKRGALSTIAWYYIRWEIIRNMPKSRRLKERDLKFVNFTDFPYSLPKIAEDKNYETILSELEPVNLTVKEKGVLRLRVAGYTMQEIGEQFDHSRGWANETFKSAIKKVRDANQE